MSLCAGRSIGSTSVMVIMYIYNSVIFTVYFCQPDVLPAYCGIFCENSDHLCTFERNLPSTEASHLTQTLYSFRTNVSSFEVESGHCLFSFKFAVLTLHLM